MARRLRDLLSNRMLLSLTRLAPAVMSFAAISWVRAVVLANLKQPVSVDRPVYRQSAMVGVISVPMAVSSS